MSGIPIYTTSPIKPSNASGVTPQTAGPQAQTSPLAPNPAPTATSASASTYPPARPGAVAFPGPTATAQRYAPPIQPTPTTQIGEPNPPPPQPGAVPTPLSRTTIPRPPNAGESYRPPQETPGLAPAMRQPYPSQMGVPPPTTASGALPPSSSTSTTTATSASCPVVIPPSEFEAPRRSLEHPPGYQQNVYASEPTSDQRRAQEANASSSIGVQDTSENVGGMDFLNTAKKWAKQAGEKLSETEKEVWRKINKE